MSKSLVRSGRWVLLAAGGLAVVCGYETTAMVSILAAIFIQGEK